MRVDLSARRLYIHSKAKDVSAGIREVDSRVIYRGDRGRLYARTTIDDEDFEQCWSVHIEDHREDAQPNPFTRGKLSRRGVASSVPGDSRTFHEYLIRISERKEVGLRVDE